jgi:hypothetical protein
VHLSDFYFDANSDPAIHFHPDRNRDPDLDAGQLRHLAADDQALRSLPELISLIAI